jgi:hypothetical protein
VYGIVLGGIGLSQNVARYTKMILTKRFDMESVGDGFFSSRNASIIRKSVKNFWRQSFLAQEMSLKYAKASHFLAPTVFSPRNASKIRKSVTIFGANRF